MIFKKFFLIVLSSLILFPNLVEAKEFKSKNGYSIILPTNHDVIEKDVSKMYERNKDSLKELDQEMFQISKRYATWITDRAENPYSYNITISVVDPLYNIVEVNKSWCPEFENLFDQMVTNKKINLYVCEKQIIKIGNNQTEVLKFKYDNPRPEVFTYQYTLGNNQFHINFGGSCIENKCDALNDNLRNIVSSLKLN